MVNLFLLLFVAHEKEQKNIGFKLFAINSALRWANLLIHMWEIIDPDKIGIVFPQSTPFDYSKFALC
jgi:hypothetical protein